MIRKEWLSDRKIMTAKWSLRGEKGSESSLKSFGSMSCLRWLVCLRLQSEYSFHLCFSFLSNLCCKINIVGMFCGTAATTLTCIFPLVSFPTPSGSLHTHCWSPSLITWTKVVLVTGSHRWALFLVSPTTATVKWENLHRQVLLKKWFYFFILTNLTSFFIKCSVTDKSSCLCPPEGVVQHLRNGQLLHHAYKRHNLPPSDWSPRQVWVETTGKSRTLQSGLAFLYGFLPDFDWTKLTVRHQWSTLFCSSACDCPARNRYLEEEQRRQYQLRVADTKLERTYADMARTLGLPPRQLRAANPIDSLLCHLCHGLSFPCAPTSDAGTGGCLTIAQFALIRQQQLDDEVDRRRAGLYRKYAILAMYPYLNRTAAKMERVAKSNKASRKGAEEVFTLSSAHDVTIAPLLSALGLEQAKFPRFAARIVFELWKSPPVTQEQRRKRTGKGEKLKPRDGELFIRVLYNGEDVTFHTAFCHSTDRHVNQPLCPLKNFLTFVRRDMFSVVNATSYREACYGRPG